MSLIIRTLIIIIVVIINSDSILTSLDAAVQSESENNAVNKLGKRDFLRRWIVAGPFPNELSETALPDGSYDIGFYTDFLVSLGGEAKAVLKAGQKIYYDNRDGEKLSVNTRQVEVDDNNILNLEKIIGRYDYKAAYAFCYIQSDKDQLATFLLGSDDAVKVWINGNLVHENYVARGLWFGEDRFSVPVKKGRNPVLVKVTQGVREWALAVEALNEEEFTELLKEEQANEDYDKFLNCTLIPKRANRWNYFFNPGKFPEMEWENEYLVEKVMGKFPLVIRWFDKDIKEVEQADKPGRYMFYAEGKTEKGMLIRRAGTMYCFPENWVAWGERFKAGLNYVPFFKNKAAWEEHQKKISDYAGRIVLLSLLDQREGAVLMSYIDEMKERNNPPDLSDTPLIIDHDYHLALKQKIMGLSPSPAKLKMPARTNGTPAVILHKGNEKDAGLKEGTRGKIAEICRQWYRESGEPFQVLVARKGIVFINESYSDPEQDVYDINTNSEIASVTKLLTGLMFAQFVDQGLIRIDDPVGKFLPDLPTEGEKALTLRHCFTHTGGLWGHEEWGGVHNPWLDNVIASLLPRISVGEKHEYNGMGYDLAGKVMEIVGNKSIFRMMRENFFDPLGLQKTILEEDLAFSCHTTAEELAVCGQLLLNRGSYGDRVFFSPETFEQLLPQPLNKYYPGIDVEWGIGITWMRQMHPQAGKDGLAEDHTILSKNVIGHGSATSAILRVDLDNDLVICQTRRNGGKFYNQYLEKFLLAIESGLE